MFGFDHVVIALAGIWPIVGRFTFWAVAMVVLAAAVYFRPAFFKPACWIAGIITAGTICYAFGVHDGTKRATAQCNVEKQLAIEGAKRARAKAQRSLARKPVAGGLFGPQRPDPDCRDC